MGKGRADEWAVAVNRAKPGNAPEKEGKGSHLAHLRLSAGDFKSLWVLLLLPPKRKSGHFHVLVRALEYERILLLHSFSQLDEKVLIRSDELEQLIK